MPRCAAITQLSASFLIKDLPSVLEWLKGCWWYAGKLGVCKPFCEALWLVDEDRTWDEKIADRNIGSIENHEYINVI